MTEDPANHSAERRYLLQAIKPPLQRYAYIGVPYDAATTLGNPGARFGPQALREALQGFLARRLEDGQMARFDRGIVDLSRVEIVDMGDIEINFHHTDLAVGDIYNAVWSAFNDGYVPIVVGGDHGVTYPAVKALHDVVDTAVGLLQLDAHADMLDFSDRQGRFSGSSGMRRSIELDRLGGDNLVQVGLRGYATLDQYEAGEKAAVHRITAQQFSKIGAEEAAAQALAWAGKGTNSIYMTVDLDVVQPGEAPGTGWPEPGGLTGQEVLDFVAVAAPYVAAIDIAELNPLYDTASRTTAVLATRIVLDFICARL